jgi:serine O-acetyltransferase
MKSTRGGITAAKWALRKAIMIVRSVFHKTWLLFNAIRLIPHLFFMKWHPNKELIRLDLERWSTIVLKEERAARGANIRNFVKLMGLLPEYRSLFYYRIGWIGDILHPLCPPMSTLYIHTANIGPGLFFQHGFATIVAANSIGKNCRINQQVTIGFSNATDCPTIGDNVVINAGAKVIGKVKVGDNSIVGANAVVVKDVPENCTVVGVPAYIVRRDGARTREPLGIAREQNNVS